MQSKESDGDALKTLEIGQFRVSFSSVIFQNDEDGIMRAEALGRRLCVVQLLWRHRRWLSKFKMYDVVVRISGSF